MQRLFLLLIVISMLGCLPFRTQAVEKIQLHHINTKGNAVRVVYRDVNGVVWLGTTSGLLSLPQLESSNPSGYLRNLGNVNMSIKRISGDSQGQLWIKTIYNDNFLYAPQRNEFVEKTSEMLAPKGIDMVGEYTVLADSSDSILVWTSNILYWLKKDASKAERIDLEQDERLRIVYPEGKYLTGLTQNYFIRLLPAGKEIIQKIPLPTGYNMRDHLFLSGNNTPWIWSSGEVWKLEGEQWKNVLHAASDITGIAQDAEDRLWISTQSEGIYLCDLEGNVNCQLRHTPNNSYGLLSDRVEAITYEPRSQLMWIAYTKGGLSFYSEQTSSILLQSIDDPCDKETVTDVLTFAPAKTKHSVWIGLEGRGVWLHNEQGLRNVIEKGSAVALHVSQDNDLWAGIYRQGLVRRSLDGKERLFFEGSSPYAITEDEDGQIYTALLGSGVWQVDPVSGETTDMRLPPRFVLDLKCHQHQLYAATTEGLYVRDNHQQWKQLREGHFHYLVFDQKGYIWLMGNEGSEGLTLLDPDGHSVDLPNELQTAPLRSIAIDKDDNVWAMTPSRLLMLHYNPEEGEDMLVRYSFNVNSDVQSVFYNTHTSYVDEDGFLWLGATTGFQRIDTRKLTDLIKGKTTAKQLLLGAISINDNLLSPGQPFNGRVLLDKDVVFTRRLDLRYNENNLLVECFQPCDDRYMTDAYYYQLKGFSNIWHPFESHSITLSNLPPGKYELLTRTQSTEAYLLLTITIAPSVWLTWWAFCIYLLLVAAIIFGFVRYNRNRHAYQLKLRKLQMRQEQQSQINEMKLRFFTNISHDLRTPLSLIIGPVEELMQSEKPDPENLRSTLSLINRNAQHLLSLVNQILDFRRLEFGKEILQLSYGDIVSLLSNTCDAFRLKAEKENIRLAFIPSVEKVETMLDRDKTTKIMMNLLSNAFKFTDSGGSIIVRLDISDGMFIISVADTGVGISDKDKDHLFDRFYQSVQNHRASMGSGIGLHIAREYVRLQGGEITVSDNMAEGQGSIFRFTLPLKKSEIPMFGTQEATKEPQIEKEHPDDEIGKTEVSQLPTLLLVDDNLDLLDYMSQSLRKSYQIHTAINGLEALNLLVEKDVDIIVCDVMMPEMDGLEFCRQVKSNIDTSHIPVVLLTAKAMIDDELKGLESGADDYITKPFSMDILRQRIHNLQERSRQRHGRFANDVDIEPSDIAVTSLDEQFIARAIAIVEVHIAEPDFSIEQFSEEIGVHRAQLYKKLHHLTGKSPQQFVRLLRLKRGRQLLEQSGLYVSEVAYKVGFNSPRLFSKYFKEEFGITPKEHTKKD